MEINVLFYRAEGHGFEARLAKNAAVDFILSAALWL
jgi:hypothetical protein